MLSQESHPISSQFLRFAIVLGVAICLAFPPSVSCLECNCDPVPRRLGDPDLVQIMFHGSFSNTSAEKINNISDRTFLEVHKHTKHGQYVWRTVTQSSTDQCIESSKANCMNFDPYCVILLCVIAMFCKYDSSMLNMIRQNITTRNLALIVAGSKVFPRVTWLHFRWTKFDKEINLMKLSKQPAGLCTGLPPDIPIR